MKKIFLKNISLEKHVEDMFTQAILVLVYGNYINEKIKEQQ